MVGGRYEWRVRHCKWYALGTYRTIGSPLKYEDFADTQSRAHGSPGDRPRLHHRNGAILGGRASVGELRMEAKYRGVTALIPIYPNALPIVPKPSRASRTTSLLFNPIKVPYPAASASFPPTPPRYSDSTGRRYFGRRCRRYFFGSKGNLPLRAYEGQQVSTGSEGNRWSAEIDSENCGRQCLPASFLQPR